MTSLFADPQRGGPPPVGVALAAAACASVVAAIVLLLASGPTQGWAVGLTVLAALSAAAGLILLARAPPEPAAPEVGSARREPERDQAHGTAQSPADNRRHSSRECQ